MLSELTIPVVLDNYQFSVKVLNIVGEVGFRRSTGENYSTCILLVFDCLFKR